MQRVADDPSAADDRFEFTESMTPAKVAVFLADMEAWVDGAFKL